MQVARDRAAARAVIEDELAELAAKKLALAPRGLDAVEQKLRTIEADRARLETALTDAAAAEKARDAATGALAANPFGEDTLDGLRQKEKDVAVQRAACDAMGTQVEIVALANLRLRGAGPAGEQIAAGGRLPLAVTQATTVVIEDVAELRFEPRGKDLAKSRGKLAQAEQDLAASLASLGVASMAEAAEAARAWRELEAARTGAEQRLAELAPQGVAKLRAEAEKVRKASRAAQDSLAEAKRAFVAPCAARGRACAEPGDPRGAGAHREARAKAARDRGGGRAPRGAGAGNLRARRRGAGARVDGGLGREASRRGRARLGDPAR